LAQKIKAEFFFWVKLYTLVIIPSIAINPNTALFVLIITCMAFCFVVTCILIKYSHYSPQKHFYGNFLHAFCLTGYVIPILLPISIVMALMYYHSAIDNLNSYLDGFN